MGFSHNQLMVYNIDLPAFDLKNKIYFLFFFFLFKTQNVVFVTWKNRRGKNETGKQSSMKQLRKLNFRGIVDAR